MDRLEERLARGWLILGVGALLAAGVFSVLLVASRTPGVQDLIPIIDFFRTALVVHVDLSVLIWFLALGGVIWTLTARARAPRAERAALICAAIGTVLVTVAAFTPEPRPLINNYVPVLQQPVFFAGLALFAAGCATKCIAAIVGARAGNARIGADATVAWGSALAAAVCALALVALAWTWLALPAGPYDAHYFERLFWGPGHTLQIAYTLLLLVSWHWLATAIRGAAPVGERTGAALMVLAALPGLAWAPWILLTEPVGSGAATLGFTRMMSYGGLLALPLMAVTARAAMRGSTSASMRPMWSALVMSLVLFAAGGVLGFLIHGVNVVIPAHYHGSIVGVTLALVGLTYLLLPRLGYRAPAPRMAALQPFVYGGGQLLHILGLAISGGYGNVQRKTAGAAQGLDNLPEIVGMGMMGLGGLIAIIGGLMFVVVVLRAMWPRAADG